MQILFSDCYIYTLTSAMGKPKTLETAGLCAIHWDCIVIIEEAEHYYKSHFEKFCGLHWATKTVDPLSETFCNWEKLTYTTGISKWPINHTSPTTHVESYSAWNRNLTLNWVLWGLFTAKRSPWLDILWAFLWNILD